MISKAAYMMQDHLRRNYPLLTDIHNPNVFIVRGRLPFPQGLAAIEVLFRGRIAADVYSHPYFIEKQSDPSQPSPQLHLTEECQGVMKVIKGLRFMKDDNSMLDNTMVIATDYDLPARGKMLTFATEDDDAAVAVDRQRRFGESDAEWRERSERMRWRRASAGRRGAGGPLDSSLRPPPPNRIASQVDEAPPAGPSRFVECTGAHTVLYNPVAADPHTFAATLRRLHDEERVVREIIVPTRQAWGSVRAWAEAFPEANILCSGHTESVTAAASTSPTARRAGGGCVDMGDGVTGLSFPEYDESDSGRESSSGAAADVDDVLRLHPRLHDAPLAEAADGAIRCSPRVRALGTVDRVELTPRLELLRVAGDDQTNEYLLYDRGSGVLACTDLFHGSYGDLDPVNSWMCRVWFKFMKCGNYKRIDTVPQFKWMHIKNHGDLGALQNTVDTITRSRPIRLLVYAHGTPPISENSANALRHQWGMPPLKPHELLAL